MILVWLAVGCALGIANTVMQWWTVARLHPREPLHAVVTVIGGMVIRWLLAAIVLTMALQNGIIPGLVAFAGMLLARWAMLVYLTSRPTLFERFDTHV